MFDARIWDVVMQVQQHVDDAVSKGAKALTGGSRPDLQAPYDKGNFFQPTVLPDCTIDMKVRHVHVRDMNGRTDCSSRPMNGSIGHWVWYNHLGLPDHWIQVKSLTVDQTCWSKTQVTHIVVVKHSLRLFCCKALGQQSLAGQLNS